MVQKLKRAVFFRKIKNIFTSCFTPVLEQSAKKGHFETEIGKLILIAGEMQKWPLKLKKKFWNG